MRSLTSTLTAAQQSNSRKPCPKLVLTSGATSYTYEGGTGERIIRIEHGESEYSHQVTVYLDNSDKTLTDLDLKGYTAVLSHGLVTSAGKEYSACAPLKVIGQRFSSAPGRLVCALQLIGIPDRIKADKADADYNHDPTSVKTVKDLITEIADGDPVPEELTVLQNNYGSGASYIDMYSGAEKSLLAQKITIDATITKLAFRVKRILLPSGNVTYKIIDVDTEAPLASKSFAATNISNTSYEYYEVTLDTPLVVDQEVWLCIEYIGGDSSNYIKVSYTPIDLVANENMMYVSGSIYDVPGWDLNYQYKHTGPGIDVFDHCQEYEVVYDSEDSLIDSYIPADSFNIRHGESRLDVIDKLLYHTGCQRIFKADGKIHIFVPTTTGTTYDSEYTLAAGHPFFAKALRKALVIPNKIVVQSNPDDTAQYSGESTSAASYALMPVSDFYRTLLESGAQANSIAAAIISRLEIEAQQGGASVPVNCGAELYDYINVIDSREADSKAGNIGSLNIVYDARKPEYSMSFSFGRVALKGVAGTRVSQLFRSGFLKTLDYNAIPWEELCVILDDMASQIDNIKVSLGWVESQPPANEVVDDAMLGYLKNIVEDTTPQLGGDLDVNGHVISGVNYLENVVEDTTPQLGGNLDVNGKIIYDNAANINLYGKTGVILYADGNWKLVVGDEVNILGLATTQNNVIGSRVLNTVYQNGNFPIICCVTVDISPGGYGYIKVEVGDSTPDVIVGYVDGGWIADVITLPFTFLVPVGAYYTIESSGLTLNNWIETKIGA